jgi:hypothetical protein
VGGLLHFTPAIDVKAKEKQLTSVYNVKEEEQSGEHHRLVVQYGSQDIDCAVYDSVRTRRSKVHQEKKRWTAVTAMGLGQSNQDASNASGRGQFPIEPSTPVDCQTKRVMAWKWNSFLYDQYAVLLKMQFLLVAIAMFWTIQGTGTEGLRVCKAEKQISLKMTWMKSSRSRYESFISVWSRRKWQGKFVDVLG